MHVESLDRAMYILPVSGSSLYNCNHYLKIDFIFTVSLDVQCKVNGVC